MNARIRLARLLALGGVAGPILFTVAVVVGGARRPGYSHLHQFMSALGETGSASAPLMNFVGFIGTGLLLAAFGLSLLAVSPGTRLGIAGAALMTLFGLGTAAAGIFSCDPGCPDRDVSHHAALHHLVSLLAFIAAIAGCGVWAACFRRLPAWRGLWRFSAGSAGVALVLLGVVLFRGHAPFAGLWQRLFIATLFLWCSVVAIHAVRVMR